MATSRLKDLFDKYVDSTGTSLEEHEFMKLLEDPARKEEILQILKEDMKMPGEQLEMPEHVASSVLEAIMHARPEEPSSDEESRQPGRRIGWRIAAAAAVVIAFLSVGAYQLLRRPVQKQVATVQQPIKEDVSPGGHKAILTLGDGKKIVLDNTADGLVSLQGNVKIIKRSNGELSYSGTGEKTAETVYNTMSTPPGGQYMLSLPDGSRVWLNASSSIRYPTNFTGHTRQVEVSGEVYFDVAKNAASPFVVNVRSSSIGSDMKIEVLGTHFNVMAYPDEPSVTTTLLEGRVNVIEGGVKTALKPGQQALLSPGSNGVEVKNANGDEAIAWTTGFFQFENLTVYAIMRQLSRWYDVRIRYEGKDPGRLFGGRISRNLDLSAVLSVLEANNIHCKIEGRTIVVLP